jgi:hypothetical protein
MMIGHVYKFRGEEVIVTDYNDHDYGVMRYAWRTGPNKGQVGTAHCSWFTYIGLPIKSNKQAISLLDREW